MSISNEELEEFKTESLELLEVAEKSLLSLDQGAEFKTAFDAIFRGFHNLKGASGMMDMQELQSHTHQLENILMPFKDKSSMPKSYISFFLRGIDAARSILNNEKINFDFSIPEEGLSQAEQTITSDSTVKEVATKGETLEAANESKQDLIPDDKKPHESQSVLDEYTAECDEILDRVSLQLRNFEAEKYTKENVDDVYRDIHSLKGASYLFDFTLVGDIAHAMESAMECIRHGTHKPSLTMIRALYKAVECIEIEVHAIKEKTSHVQTKIIAPIIIEELLSASRHLEIVNLIDTAKQQSESAVQSDVQQKENESAGSIRVPVVLLDNLMTLMGEMVLVRNQVMQFSSQSEDLEFLNLSKRLNSVTSDIQGQMMKTRMQPIGNILGKFHRVVRDLSHDLKKNINLTLNGSETELDKSLLEAIKDPLTHIIRNSCDHGIETPEVRKLSGKGEAGTINVKSYHEGGQVVIEINDDGKGLHRDVLIKKAIEKGLLNQTEATSLSDKDAFNLIFAPGFSTAAAITNVSGRGVGMDVVRTNIEKIGGNVELQSVAGKGTTTKIKIPLTLAIVPALIVRCGQDAFAIPQAKLEELVRIDSSSVESKIEYLHGSPVYRLRGNILPLVDLNKILGRENKKDSDVGVTNIAILNAENCSFGLIVDEVQDTADIVVKPLNRLLKSLQVYSGATILGDGSIALILDVMGISKIAGIGSEKNQTLTMDAMANGRSLAELQEYLIVRLNSPTKHAIVLGYVNRLEEFKKSNFEMSGLQKVIRYGKSILPIISVSQLLGYGQENQPSDKETVPVVVIQKAGMFYGLEVDAIVDTLSTEAEVSPTLVAQTGIFGNLNTPEELIVLIDPFELIQKAFPTSAVDPISKTGIAQSDPVNMNPNIPARQAIHEVKILLVEDTLFFRRAIRSELEKVGHQVAVVNDGKEALELLEKNPAQFDLVISDIEMPRMNGYDLAKSLRQNNKLSHLPLLALSSRADQKSTHQGIQSGFDMYLEKLQPPILLNAVSRLTDGQRRVS